jgi:hypothetical protein
MSEKDKAKEEEILSQEVSEEEKEELKGYEGCGQSNTLRETMTEKALEEEILSQEVSKEEKEETKKTGECYLLPDYTPHPCWNNSVR